MKFGVQINCYDTTWDDLEASIQAMEAGRWHSLWFADHFLAPGREEHRTAFEGFTLISVVAGMTQKLRLGHLVLACSASFAPGTSRSTSRSRRRS